MERYKILGELGDGTCGCVYKALNMETLEIVAVKKMKRKFYYWEECMNLREVKALRRLDHPNVVKLKEVVRENNELFFVFEYMEHNLYQIIRERHGKPFSEEEIRHYISQVLQGLDHMHKNGYFHRDLKPENLLVTDNALKIADLGLAREVSSAPPYTEYVSTRWYRAPEVLLQSSAYTPAIDMWAVGAIVAELFTLSPIFPGDSEFDQLYKICRVLGLPEWYSLPGGTNFSRLMNISFSEIFPTDLSAIIPNASPEAIDLIKQLCSWNPMKRPTAEEALKHPFFHAWKWGPINSDESKLDRIGAIPNLELNLWDFGNQTDDCFLGLTLAVNPSNKSLDVIHSVSRGLADDILFGSAYEDGAEPSGEVLDLLELLHGCFTSLTQCRKMLARHFLVTFVYGLFIGRYFHLTKVNTLRRLILHCHSPSAAQLGIIPPWESHCRPGCPSLLCSPICWTALCWPLALLFDIGFKEVSCLLSHIPVNKGRTLH